MNSRNTPEGLADRPPAEDLPKPPSQLVSQLGALLLGLVPVPLLVYGWDASWRWVGLGSLSWITAVLLKVLATGIAYNLLSSARASTRAAVSGVLSGASELGVAAVFFQFGPPGGSAFVNALAFGTAAGCTELLLVLGAGYFDKPSADNVSRWMAGAGASVCVRHIFLIERTTALMGHVGARGLVSLSLYGETKALAVIALLGFALTDGLAAYGGFKDWDWFDPARCRMFYGICVAISVVEVACFVIFGLPLL